MDIETVFLAKLAVAGGIYGGKLYRQKLDYIGSTVAGVPIYIAFAPSGSATSAAVWTIFKTLFGTDAQGNPAIAGFDPAPDGSIYDNRTTLTYT